MSEEVEKNMKLLKELLNKCDERDCRIVRQLYVILRNHLQKQGRIDLQTKQGGASMSVKIRVSYENPQELQAVLEQLAPMVQSHKISKRQEGQYKKAYIVLKEEVKNKRIL